MDTPLSLFFFLNFIELRQLDQFRSTFLHEAAINPSTVRISADIETVFWESTVDRMFESGQETFGEYLEKLFAENKVSLMTEIHEQFLLASDKSVYIQSILKQILLLIEKTKRYKELSKYPKALEKVKSLSDDICYIYNIKLEKSSTVKMSSKQSSLIPSGLVLKTANNRTIQNLYSELIKYQYISPDTPFSSFLNLFESSASPALKIKWTMKIRGTKSKYLIFFFMDEMAKAGLVNQTTGHNAILLLENIFIDHEGYPFKNGSTSYPAYVKAKCSSKEYLNLLSIIRSLTNQHLNA